jgi:hypothetical protein
MEREKALKLLTLVAASEESSAVVEALDMAIAALRSAPAPQDGPENSAQQLYGKMPKSCLECPVAGVCSACPDVNDSFCEAVWRGLFRHFAV